MGGEDQVKILQLYLNRFFLMPLDKSELETDTSKKSLHMTCERGAKFLAAPPLSRLRY